MDGNPALNILLVLVFVLIGGVFAATEMALVTLRESQIKAIAARGRRGEKVASLARNPNTFLAAVQIGVTVAGFASAAYGASAISPSVVPLFVVWFGSGTVPAILTSMVICIFPVVVNVATGLASTEPELEDVLKVLGASKRDVLWNVGLPRTLPYLFASLKIAITLAFVGTVLSETVAANKGIGTVMMIASGNFDVPLVFAGLFLLAGMGVALYALSSFVEHRMTGWAQRKTDMVMA